MKRSRRSTARNYHGRLDFFVEGRPLYAASEAELAIPDVAEIGRRSAVKDLESTTVNAPVDTAAPVDNVDNPAATALLNATVVVGGVAHVAHRRLENSLREFPTVTTGDDGDEFSLIFFFHRLSRRCQKLNIMAPWQHIA